MKRVLIIGSGILGASAAYHLTLKGADVTVVDRQDKGQATDAAAGIICPWLSQRRNKAWYLLAKNGAHYYKELIDQLEHDGESETGYRQVGAICIQTETEKLMKIKERATDKHRDAPEMGNIQLLSSEETSASFPLLLPHFSSIHIGGAARVNGRALRNALRNAATKRGATFVDGSAELVATNNSVTGVQVGERVIEADTVIVTAGAWAGELLAPLGIHLQVTGKKAQIIHLQLEQTDTKAWPVVMPPSDQYILAFDDGRVVIGATHEDDTVFDQRVTAGGVHEVLDKALLVAPGLAKSELVETRVGFRPYTPGFLPIIGEVPGVKGLLLANGLGASGLTVGPYLGKQLAKLAIGEQVDIDLDLYSLSSAIN